MSVPKFERKRGPEHFCLVWALVEVFLNDKREEAWARCPLECFEAAACSGRLETKDSAQGPLQKQGSALESIFRLGWEERVQPLTLGGAYRQKTGSGGRLAAHLWAGRGV
jgi:hypothetical protein